jgi:GntR family transcriptional regulator / MocR family aminotransferase
MLHLDLERHPSHRPYYLQILEQIRSSILSGEFPAGMQLPPSRQLAIELGIARRTVVIAYEELCAQGYCVSQVGRGTVVALITTVNSIAPDRERIGLPQWLKLSPDLAPDLDSDRPLICFAPSLAQTDRLPLKAMQQAFQAIVQTAPTRFQEYDRNNGHASLLAAICQHVLPDRGIQATPDRVMITNGSLHSSFLLAQLFAPYGGSISYGVPGYLAIPANFIKQGITGLPCRIDAEGVCLTDAARSARFHYVMPEHHFPHGVTLSPERRASLLQLADRHEALIIEDDYDSEFYFDRHPLPALKAIDRTEKVIYMGTFSKILFNGLRVGYIVAHPTIVQQLVDLRWRLDGGTSLVLQLWLAELLNTGTVERHLRRMRVHHRKKRNLIADYLRQNFPDWRWQLPSGGLQFWIQLPPEQDTEQAIQQWLASGVRIFPGSEYCGNSVDRSNNRNHLILGFGAVTETQIHQAFSQLCSTTNNRSIIQLLGPSGC